jgi:beta-lactamase regulating signal transducer with metallopeptidase domain
VATAAAMLASRLWRGADATFRHQIWTTIAVASLVMPIVVIALPATIQFAVPGAAVVLNADRLITVGRALDLVALVYLGGVALAFVRLVAGLLVVRRLVGRSTMPEGLPADRLHEAIGAPALRCRVHQRLQVPITVGWLNPHVLLPPTWILWDASRRDAVVRHELAHVGRRDFVWNLIAAVQHAIYWFSPAAWIVARRIRLSAELACDEHAAAVVGSSAYARVLVETARDATRNGTRAGILAVGATTELEARVEALVSAAPVHSSTSRRTRAMVVIAIAAALAGAATVRLGAGTTNSDPPFSAAHRAVHQAQHQAAHQH